MQLLIQLLILISMSCTSIDVVLYDPKGQGRRRVTRFSKEDTSFYVIIRHGPMLCLGRTKPQHKVFRCLKKQNETNMG